MLEPGEFNPLVYWAHVVLGFASVAFVLSALFTAKGAWLHRRSGLLFAITMGVAAVTALAFILPNIVPGVMISAVSVLYGIGMGLLGIRQRQGGWRLLELTLIAVPSLLAILFIAFAGIIVFTESGAPPFVPFLLVIGGAIFATYAWGDIRYARAVEVSKNRRLRRHAIRLALAGAEVVRAPLISFAPEVFGEASFFVYFFGPFLLIPLIYVLAMPKWLKTPKAAPV